MLSVETWLWPVSVLDALRARLLTALGGLATPIVRRPELRVALRGSVAVLLATVGSLCLPLWILALGPLVLGIPHLLSDARYLVVRPGLQRSWRLRLGVGLPLLVCGLGAGMPAGLCALLGAVVLGEGRLWRKVVGVLVVAAIAAPGLWQRDFYIHELLLAHLHNPLGVVIWLLWRPRQQRLHYLPLALYGLMALLIGAGALSPLGFGLGSAPQSAGNALSFLRDALAPGLSETWGTRLLLLYCYAQMFHYSVWLQLVPEEDRARPTPRSFRQSLLALRADLPVLLLGGALLAMVGLWLWAVVDVWASRVAYFRLATFHGYLELCALGLWWVAGRGPQRVRPLGKTSLGMLPMKSPQ